MNNNEVKDDYSYWSENLHSSYLFYTMEVDKLSKENKRLTQKLEKTRDVLNAISKAHSETVPRIMKYAKQALEQIKTNTESIVLKGEE